MKKYISITVGILMSIHLVYSQKTTLMENFDGDTVLSISSPANAWNKDSNYYVSGTYSYRGKVPHVVGDSIILTTQVYDFSNYNYVLLRFSHICKVSPQDIVRIEYRLNNMRWQVLPASAYFGKALLYQTKGFSANSYTDWQAEDSLSSPLQSWWKEEIFDVGSLVVMDNGVQFRFILKHGNTPGTQISYGWLIDNVEIIASTSEIVLPVVEFLTPLVKDTVYNTGAWEINVRLKSPSNIQIENPWLVYTANNSQGTVMDSVLMTSVKGDSLWRASIPQLTAGTTVQYAVTGRDIQGYYTTIQSNYIIVRPAEAGNTSVSVNLASIDMTDTVLVSPSSKIPIVATIRNSGVLNLDSVRISYSVNNVVAGSKSVYLNPALPWDFILKDTLGNYRPKSNGKDTVTVWVSMPNGQQDAVTNDDTLRKIIYGSSDIIMSFKDAPDDTVYNTGPFDITAEIYTLSGNTIGTVTLNLTCIFQGDTTGETLQMSNTSGNLWKTTVPKKIAGQKVIYSIEQTDALGNHAVVKNSYFIKNINTNANSVSLTAINIPDTIFVSPDSIIPVVFSIQNRGILDLDSVKVSYAVNGFTSTEKNIHIKPALAWDFMFTDTIGYYTPKVNGYDTVTVLIRMPNGQQDAVANDDSLRKIIYGSSDIMMRFIEYPDDTVYNTGPFDVTAEIYSYSAAPLGQISLLLTSRLNGNTAFDTLPMLRSSGNLWKTTLPRKAFGSDVSYAIKRTDILDNLLVIEKSYYIQRLPEDTVAEVIIGTGTGNTERTPMALYLPYSFSRQLYLGTEFAPEATGVTITQLGWYYGGSATTYNIENQYCYFQVVDDTAINSSAYIDPDTNGATLVWEGNFSVDLQGWEKFTLKEPFVLPKEKNLLIYWNHKFDNSTISLFTSLPWRYTATPFYSVASGTGNTTFELATTSSLQLSTARPNAWFYVIPKPKDSNSVALVEINSPADKKGILVNGTATPVQVTILNKGIPDMDSCIIGWSLNGQIQSPATVYRGALAETLTDTITIGSYFPVVGKWDTIVTWVSMPNGVVDSTVKDDTLKVIVFGCASVLSDTITIGEGGDFTSINDVVDNMRYCGTSGDITLLLKGTFHENMDLSDLPIEGSLTITSADNHADSAIIKPLAGTGITLGNNKHVTLKTITIDVSEITASCIQFIDTCNNITIRDCKLLANPASTTADNAAIYKVDNSAMDSIFITKNLLDGGYYGCYINGGRGLGAGLILFSTNVVFDSNTVNNTLSYGTYFNLVDFTSCSYNIYMSRTEYSTSSWGGIYMTQSYGGSVSRNKIIQQSNNSNGIGISFSYMNNYGSLTPIRGRSLIDNNEIILTNGTGITIGSGSKCEVIHNSIYMSGGSFMENDEIIPSSGTQQGISINNSVNFDAVVKNNNIALNTVDAHPFYITSSPRNYDMCDMDYNNYYAPTYLGWTYRVGAISSMAVWQVEKPTDLHSVRVLPLILHPSTSLKFLNMGGLFCEKISSVSRDKDNASRATQTTMGCYEISIKSANATVRNITGLKDGSLLLDTNTVKVVVQNTGTTALSSINLSWSANEVLQATGIDYPVSLSMGQIDTLILGQITYSSAGAMKIKVWINSIDSGSLWDEDRQDDTLSKTITVCGSKYSGTFTIGTNPNNDFTSINQCYAALNLCGVDGDITLLIDSGVYAENLDFSDNDVLMSNHLLTISSRTNNANNVIIRPPSGIGVLLFNTYNLVLKGITVDAATNGTNAIQFMGTCTNITVRDCKLLVSDTTTNTAIAPIYKGSATGVVDNIVFINNQLDGGYCGFYFYGGAGYTAGLYGTNIVFDSNTVTNAYYYGIYPYYVDFTSCSYNNILSRTANISTTWYGLPLYYTNGSIIGNKIKQRSNLITNPYGIYLSYYNYYPTTQVKGRGLIANNEIILNTTGAYYGIYMQNSKSEIIHNSIYISGSGAARGIHIVNSVNNNIVIKNNNIVLSSATAHPVYFSATGNTNLYTLDYNNYYAPTYVGYYGGAINTISAWKQQITTDQHSVKVLPDFVDTALSLELLTNNDSLLCPVEGVQTDIRGFKRNIVTTMGAYINPPVGQDMVTAQIIPWNTEIINNQIIQVNTDIFNMGVVPITDATFEWSVNGIIKGTLSWHPTQPLHSLEQRNIPIGSFQATATDTFKVAVWIKTVNGQQDTVNWNDTAFAIAVIQPLTEFVTPVEDTIYVLDFTVNAKIRSTSGAPVTPPNLYVETVVNNFYFLHDTLPMTLNNGLWQANIPPKYYGSKVIYSLEVSDSIQNTFIARDSIYIQSVELGKTDTVVIGTGVSTAYNYPLAMYSAFGWSRQIYLYREICPDLSPTGTRITKMAFHSTTASVVYPNQICYMRATDDTIESVEYMDPLITNGVSQVWAGTIYILPGWVEITLDNPFYLPPNKNLEIIWEHRASNYASTRHTWTCSTTPTTMTVYNQSSLFPTTSGTRATARPNIKIAKEAPFNFYTGTDLGMISILSPINDFDKLCATDYVPLTVAMGNLGDNEYNFSTDTVAMHFEIIDPQQTTYTGYMPIHTGKLASGEVDTVELMSALSVIYPGRYELKVWLESPSDNIIYDNTLVSTYISGKLGLPIDEDFSNDLPMEFITRAVNSSATWTIIPQGTGSDTTVKPVFGSGMLAFTGNKGAMSYLSTRQLELRETVLPTLEFWYFHDTIKSEDYMDVRISTDGGSTYKPLLSVLKQDSVYGWYCHRVDLTPFINGQCIQILFEAMRMSSGVGSQYIDRIVINSQQDLALSKITLPLQSVCDLTTAELEVIISTKTNQSIDLSQLSTSLAVEIPNYPSLAPIPLHKKMDGNSSDTIYIAVPNLPAGIYPVKVYLTSAVDKISGNDTAYYTVDIRPELSITVKSSTGGKNCFKTGVEVQQELILINSGNIDLPNIELLLNIIGDNPQTIKENNTINLSQGDTLDYRFKSVYIVPKEVLYAVKVTAYVDCNGYRLIDTSHAASECADLDNLNITELVNPSVNSKDVPNTTEQITVLIRNESDIRSFSNVIIMALIEDKDGVMLYSRMGTIPRFEADSTYQFTFTEPYNVPDDTVYYIRIYLNNMDIYPEDDTLKRERHTESVDINTVEEINTFTLGQNIPNPATNTTRIDYSIPETGKVTFYLHSLGGQLLYSKTIDAVSGKQRLELNTSIFSSGVYFYSMEYKGQRLVRQLIINN